MKWNVINRVRVASLTANPSHFNADLFLNHSRVTTMFLITINFLIFVWTYFAYNFNYFQAFRPPS